MLFAGLSALVVMASCSKTAGPLETLDEGTEASFSATFEAPTKVTYTEDDSAVRVAWKDSDQIGIWTANASATINSNCAYKADEAAAESSFSYISRAARIHWASETDPQSFYAFYPYSKDSGSDPHKVNVTLPSVQTQESANDISHLARYDLMWAAAENKTKSEGEIPFTFHHAFSVLELDLQTDTRMKLDALIFRCTSNPSAAVSFEGATMDLSSGEIDLTGAKTSSEARLDCGFATSWPASSKMYMVVNAGLAGETVEIVAVIGGKEKKLVTRTVPEGGLPKGKVACVKVDYTVPEDVAIKIKDLGETGTANCYLVTEPSQYYKFKATVKGNGVIPSGLSDVATSTDIAPKSVVVLWYNTVQTSNTWVDKCPILLSSLVFFRDYVYFDTPKEFVPGNVVIAAFAEEGVTAESITADEDKVINNATLLWSWNIWAAEGYDPEATAISTASSYKFMDRYVGAGISGLGTTGRYEPTGAVGNYYQWGRKDPVPAIADYTNFQPTTYSNQLFCTPTYTPVAALRIETQGNKQDVTGQIFGYPVEASGKILTAQARNIVQKSSISPGNTNKEYVDYSVSHPYKLIAGSTQDGYYNSWLNAKEASYKAMWGSVKTLYDPCPVGWRVSTKDEATEFLSAVSGAKVSSNNCGAELDGHYFPLNGTRSHDKFLISDSVYSCGYTSPSQFWTSSDYGYYAYMMAARVILSANYVSAADKSVTTSCSYIDGNGKALNVRCIKE